MIDLRQLNQFVKTVPFKMEDLTQLPSVLQKGDFLCKIDLQDAYLTIPVAKKARVYLRFLWKGKLYQFTCLPFGLASSPRIFTKCLKPLLVYLWALGVRLLGLPGRYPDNGSCKEAMSGTGPANCEIIGEAQLCDKSREISTRAKPEVGIPRVCNRHCGNEVVPLRNENTQNSESGREISLRTNFRKTASQFSGPVAGNPSSYQNSSFIFSKSPERPFQGSKSSEEKRSYWTVVALSTESRGELMWWKNWFPFHNGKSILGPKEQETVLLDASKEGWGAHLGPLEMGGRWCLED